MSNVTLKNIKKAYDNKRFVINGVDLEIKDKEFIVIVGASGCGKSTILRMIAGLEDISNGEILIDDKVVNKLHPKDRDVAFVFQNYALYPHMTVFENMAFGLKMRKVKPTEIKQKVESTAETLGLTPYLNRKPKQLSGGQRQRLAIARAMLKKPDILILDEATSNLDAITERALDRTIHEFSKKMTTIFIAHRLSTIKNCDIIFVMDKGKIIECGNHRELIELGGKYSYLVKQQSLDVFAEEGGTI